ncbi:MAG: hypothetical protein WDN04_09165 [Rhodospirillales bacterium]
MVLSDTASNLLATPPGVLAFATGTQLNAAATVNAAGFATLHDVMHTATGGYVLTVSDNAANLLALAGNLPPATVTVLSADATLSAQQVTTLVSEPHFSTGVHVLTIADTASNLLALAPNVRVLAGATQLTAAATVNIADFATLRDVLHIATGGYTVTISDTAANLVSIAAADLSLATACVLSADGSLSAADAQTLALEPGLLRRRPRADNFGQRRKSAGPASWPAIPGGHPGAGRRPDHLGIATEFPGGTRCQIRRGASRADGRR